MENKKVLYKNTENKMLAGVCAGISEYFDIDVTIVRVLVVFVAWWAGIGVILYIVLALILPDKSEVTPKYDDVVEGEFKERK